MRGRVLSIMAGVAVAIATSVGAHAQNTASVRAYVPFAFSVSDSALPAGDYTLTQLSQNTWVVRNNGGKRVITAAARPDGTNKEETAAKLVFTKYGEHYFLSKVWRDGLTTQIAEPNAERAIQIQMTSRNEKPQTIYLMASAR
jgi:hypothetical protein